VQHSVAAELAHGAPALRIIEQLDDLLADPRVALGRIVIRPDTSGT
jgi:hypothetical protein